MLGFRLAQRVAKQSTHHQHHLGAALMRGGAVVALSANGAKGRGHAEARALRPHMDASGCHLFVARLNGQRISRPCYHCAQKIRAAGIDRVTFVDRDGTLKTIRANQL